MEAMFKGGVVRTFARGDTLEVKDEVNYIKSGAIAIYDHYAEKNECSRLVIIRVAGEIFPIWPITSSVLESRRSVSFKVLKTTTVITIPRNDFMSKVKDGKYASEVYNMLSRLLLITGDRIDNLLTTNTRLRLVERILYFCRRFGIKDGRRVIIDLPVTHTELAQSISATRETVNRYIRDLEKAGLISMRQQTIVVDSVENLRNYARSITGNK